MKSFKKFILEESSEELDEASKPNQYIEVTNKFTGSKSYHEVHPTKAFAALNHHKGLWQNKAARIVSGKEAEGIRASNLKNEEVDLDENGIKGWKHAAADISKMRSAQGKTVKLVSLKKDGNESKMHDATKTFRSEDEAQEHHDRVTKLNPNSKIRHNLYVDGKHVKTLG